MNRKVLILAANHWTSPSQVGTHSIAREFVKSGWDVAFISDPISPFHFLKRNKSLIAQRLEIYKSGGQKYLSDKLITYVPFSLVVPQNLFVLRSKFVYHNWQKFTFPNLYTKLKQFGFLDVDLIYFDHYTYSFLLDIVNYNKSVFRIADNYSGYKKYTQQSRLLEKKIIESVDLILYTSKNLLTYFNEYKFKESFLFPNGVDFYYFNTPANEIAIEYNSIPKPRVIYIGEMEVRFDFELLKYAALKLPSVSFVLVGDDSISREKYKNIKNIYILGIKSIAELPKYLQNADLGIIPFNVIKLGELIDYVNPIKLYQYFACGLPVVSARWKTLEELNTPTFLYDTKEEFVNLIEQSLKSKPDKNQLFDVAKKLDWATKFNTLMEKLDLND